MTRAVPRGPDPRCHGISAKVSMSGIRYWSDSAIRVKPSIDEPSNHVPCSTEPSSWWIGIVTALTWPMMSVNWSWTKRMPRGLRRFDLGAGLGLLATWSMPPGGREHLSTGRAARGTSAAATGRRRRRVSSSSATTRSAFWAGITDVDERRGLGLDRPRLVGLVLGVLERRRSRRRARRRARRPSRTRR